MQATGHGIQPYEDHPALLPALFTLLNESKTPTLRTGALRVLGVMGACDSYREKLQDTRLQAVFLANKQRDAAGEHRVCADSGAWGYVVFTWVWFCVVMC